VLCSRGRFKVKLYRAVAAASTICSLATAVDGQFLNGSDYGLSVQCSSAMDFEWDDEKTARKTTRKERRSYENAFES